MKGIIKFHMGLLRMPRIVQLWVAVLILMNLIIPLFFLGHLEAQVTIGVFLVGAVLLMLVTGMTGFTRLLGLGHILWFPLLAWLWLRLELFPVDHWMGL